MKILIEIEVTGDVGEVKDLMTDLHDNVNDAIDKNYPFVKAKLVQIKELFNT